MILCIIVWSGFDMSDKYTVPGQHYNVSLSVPCCGQYLKMGCLETNPVEKEKLKPVSRIYIYEGSNKGFVFHPRWTPRPDTAAYSQKSTQTYTQTDRHTRTYTHTHTQVQKGKEIEEKNLDPSSGLCVGTGEQFVLQNSHYQHSAAGLQLAGVEHSVARPNERLIFLPFC